MGPIARKGKAAITEVPVDSFFSFLAVIKTNICLLFY